MEILVCLRFYYNTSNNNGVHRYGLINLSLIILIYLAKRFYG